MLTSFGHVFRGVGSLFCVLGVKKGAQSLHSFCDFVVVGSLCSFCSACMSLIFTSSGRLPKVLACDYNTRN